MGRIISLVRLILQGIGVVSLVGLTALFFLDTDTWSWMPDRILSKVSKRAGSLPVVGDLLAGQRRPEVQTAVLVNQLGYRPEDPKIGFVKSNMDGQTFEVANAITGKTVYTGTIQGNGHRDESTGDITSVMDFSAFTTPGAYFLRVPVTSLKSNEFRISETVYQPAFVTTLESFYYQRCGTEVNIGTIWQHPPCHLDHGVFYENPSQTRDVSGGWHDAGDHGKYVVTGAPSAAFLLYLYEHAPDRFTDGQTTIPESGNGIPDLLDEVRWELEWLLKFQRDDGALYHKVAAKKWSGNYLPHEDPDVYYINPISSTATADFAAVTALASRIFNQWDKPFAYRLLKASRNAWAFLSANPEIVPRGGFRNPPGVVGGDYSDGRDIDERLWAAVELYRLTGDQTYHTYFVTNYQRAGGFHVPFGWQNVDSFAYASYLHLPQRLRDHQVYNAILGTLTSYCDERLTRIEYNGYRHVLRTDEFYWGSNSVALGEAFKLIEAYAATNQTKYRNGALDQFHYILGRNTFNITFATGIGSNPVLFPYHQFTMKLGVDVPVPGMAVGGPNNSNIINGRPLSEFPGKCYQDSEEFYQVNEIAINYTAPLVFVSGYFAAFER